MPILDIFGITFLSRVGEISTTVDSTNVYIMQFIGEY